MRNYGFRSIRHRLKFPLVYGTQYKHERASERFCSLREPLAGAFVLVLVFVKRGLGKVRIFARTAMQQRPLAGVRVNDQVRETII